MISCGCLGKCLMRTCVRNLPSLGLPHRHPPSLSWRLAALLLQASLLAQPFSRILQVLSQ